MRTFNLFNIFLFFSILQGCIEPVDIEVGSTSSKLVVLGEINNSKGPYTILLSRTATYDVFTTPKETGAIVYVEDLNGNRISFEEEEDGKYVSCANSPQGVVGGFYQLTIITVDESEYKSSWQEILPPADLIDIEYSYKEISGSSDFNSIARGINVTCSFKDNEAKEYFKIEWEGIYKFRASIYDENNDFCWNYEKGRYSIELYSDEYSNNKVVDFVPVTFLESGLRFTNEYYINVLLKSISEQTYNYWRLVKQQNETDGSIFSPLPAQISGNIYNVNDSTERVLGMFYSSGITNKDIELPVRIIPGRNEAKLNCERFKNTDPLPGFCYDCTKFQRSVAEKPEMW